MRPAIRSVVLRRLATIAPAVAVPLTKLMADGDSLIDNNNSSINFLTRYMVDNSISTANNISVSGACIAASENGGNNLMSRVSTIIAGAPSHLIVVIGANDLVLIDAATTISRAKTYIAALRAGLPSLQIIWGTVTPTTATGRSGVNARRATLSGLIFSDLLANGYINAVLDIGGHPIMTDTAPNDATLFDSADRLHPIAAGWYWLRTVLDAVMAPIVAASTATKPTLTIEDIDYAPISTAVEMWTMVTGVGLGQGALLTADIGTIARNQDTAGSSATLYNGQVLRNFLTSSGSKATTLTQTITGGTVAETFTVKTEPTTWPTVTATLDPANKLGSVTLSNGNLTAAGADGTGAIQLVRSTQQGSNDLIYFEEVIAATGTGFMGVMDSSVAFNSYTSPGIGGNSSKGATVRADAGQQLALYLNGSAITAQDFINFPTFVSGGTLGIALQKSTGRFWVRDSNGWLHGDPTKRLGGFKLATPLAQNWCFGSPIDSKTVTMNYGNSGPNAYTFTRPIGFAPVLP